MTSPDASAAEGSRWQEEDGLCAAVLSSVFSWLEAPTLGRAAAVCRSWRRAAAAPALWRRLLLRRAPRHRARALQRHVRSVGSWREEYVRAFAGWERREAVARVARGAREAALCPEGRLLALLTEDAELEIWQVAAPSGAEPWRRCWSTCLRARGWASGERAQWAARRRLLLTGALALALAHSWELLALQIDEEGVGHVISHARCSAGAGGCWAHAGGEAYLSLEARSLAPSRAYTVVHLNAATQKTESEYAGVTTPLLRMFNEGGALITLAAVVEDASEPNDVTAHSDVDHGEEDDDDEQYFRAARGSAGRSWAALLVTGDATALRVWRLRARRPPPLQARAHGELRTRHAARLAATAAAAAAPRNLEPAPAPLSEAEVRAMCDAARASRALPARPLALVPLPSGLGAWVSLSDGGAWCLALPSLRPLRRLQAATRAPPSALSHAHLRSALSELYYASPTGGAGGGTVQVWSAWSGAACEPERSPTHEAPVSVVALLPVLQPAPSVDARPLLLVLVEDAIHVWRSRATSQELGVE